MTFDIICITNDNSSLNTSGRSGGKTIEMW